MEKFHEKLKKLRKKKGFTQQEVADICGVRQAVYAKWENAKMKPIYENLSMLACIFDVSIDYLLSENLEISKESYLKLKEEKKNLFSVRLKELRLQHGFSQEELAEKSGVSRALISGLETGNMQETSTVTLKKLAKFFNIKVSDLFF